MQTTKIEWATHTWNPVTGCTEVSPGCDHCYARTIAEKYRGTPAFPVGFDVMLRPHKLRDPIKLKQPARIFVNSMSDCFHKDIPDDYLKMIWATMLEDDRHIYQVLTKRAHRMAHKIKTLGLATPPHIWLGVSAENQEVADSRIPALLSIGSAVPWISAEPLLGPLDLRPYLPDLKWVVDGGESGSGRRLADYGWFKVIRDQCGEAGTFYFHKQGNHFRSGQDRLLDGRTWDEYPNKEE